ncbi:MAG: glycosyltransferase family 2 protein [Kiritimatiellae bacterium]|nr:glycosyltransferase family 2 protein [Kiritimatiellia bacterium]MDW8458486.1 glycosyltransferase family 2 protein [Verrucomicrobiota bacterium]
MKTVSVVVPFLNEEENLPVLYERVKSALSNVPEKWELVLVDDGSTDGSAAWATQKAAEDPRVKLVQLSRNFGHQIAITAGMDYATGDAVVIIDADLQDPPEVIPELLARWREGFEVVYAVRKSREGETWLKKFLAAAFYRIFYRMSRVKVPMDAGDFRLVDRKVVDALRNVRELHRFMRGLTCWVGFRQCAVYYERAARHAGVTKYPIWKSLNLAWDGFTSFSGAPLRWMTGIGLFFSLAGLLFALRVVLGKIFGWIDTVRGWTSLMAVVLVLGGIQLMCMGLLGQYVSRIFEETKKRPLYFVRSTVGFGDSGNAR